MLGLLIRTFVHRGTDLWKLEFAIAAWNPYHQSDKNKLEKVQNWATKLSHFLKGFNSETRRKLLNLTSLSMRHTRGDLIQKYKLENNLEVINWHNKPLSISAREATVSNKYHRELIRNCIQRHNFFNNRIANAWNALPNNVTSFTRFNLVAVPLLLLFLQRNYSFCVWCSFFLQIFILIVLKNLIFLRCVNVIVYFEIYKLNIN